MARWSEPGGAEAVSGFRKVSQRRLVAEYRAAVERHVASNVALPSEQRIGDRCLIANTAVGPEDGALDDGLFLHLRLAPDHGVWSDARARLHQHPFVDEHWPLDRGAF